MNQTPVIVKANLEKRIEIESIIPDEIEKLSLGWSSRDQTGS